MRVPFSLRRALPLVAAVALAACDSVTEPNPELGPSFGISRNEARSSSGSYIVVARGESLPESLRGDVRDLGGHITRELPQIGVAFVQAADSRFADQMSKVSGIQAVVPDMLMERDDPTTAGEVLDHGSAVGAGFFDALTWGVDAVGAPAAWADGNRGAGVRVAVVDAGIDPTHPDLAPNLNADLSASFVPCDVFMMNCDGPWEDWRITPGFYFNHGTHVAGTIAGTGDLGVTGVAPEAELVVIKACTEFADACFTSSIVSGLVYAADVDADIVNMSIGGLRRMRNDFVKYCRDELELPANVCGQAARFNATFQDDYVRGTILVYQRAFEYLHRQGTTLIVAAGNSAIDADRSGDIKLAFADFPQNISVSALGPLGWCLDPSTSTDELAYYSNYGQSVIDFAGPGGSFLGGSIGAPFTDPCTVGPATVPAYVFDGVFSTIAGGWGWASGTSMAAPHAAGVAALLIAANGGAMSPSDVESALKATAVDLGQPGHDAIYGYGKVSTGY